MKRRAPRVTFKDMPAHLQHVDADSPPTLKRERESWLAQSNLSFIDSVSWRREQGPLARLRPPSRRRLMTPEQIAELDSQREREGDPRW
jgi:hypothetical protein